MKIIFTAAGENWESLIDSRFGRSDYLVIYDEEKDELRAIDNRQIKNEAHGAGTATAQKVFNLKPDVLITGNGPGENAASALKHLDMKIFVNAHKLSLAEAYRHYKEGKLNEI
jgi:predicted Fe-Mo cluster-binding NifX family protein